MELGKTTGIQIATVYRCDEVHEVLVSYHILPAAENSMLPVLTALPWPQQKKKNTR